MSKENTLFKISFINQGKVYEIFARQVAQSSMIGFIEVEELVFGGRTAVVVDPAEEKLKDEFSGVKRTYIPMHAVIRIDEVEKQGTAKILSLEGGTTVTPITPGMYATTEKPDLKS